MDVDLSDEESDADQGRLYDLFFVEIFLQDLGIWVLRPVYSP